MQPLLVLAWAAAGAVAGFAVNRLSWRLERAELAGFEEISLRRSPWRNYFMPAAAALLAAALAWKLGPTPMLWVASLWVLVLLQVMVVDFEYRVILDWVVLPAAVVALALAVFLPTALEVKDWKVDLLCGGLSLAFFALLYFAPLLLFKTEAMGFGDVKLGLFLGLALGPAVLPAVVYGIIIGGVIPGLLLLFRLKKRRDYVPYGPFLCAGALAAILLRP